MFVCLFGAVLSRFSLEFRYLPSFKQAQLLERTGEYIQRYPHTHYYNIFNTLNPWAEGQELGVIALACGSRLQMNTSQDKLGSLVYRKQFPKLTFIIKGRSIACQNCGILSTAE